MGKLAEHDVYGYVETLVNYYLPGVDTSQLSDHALALKVAHLTSIRKAEGDSQLSNMLNDLIR